MVKPSLRERAERAGILPSYRPAGGGALRKTGDATRTALLAALGPDRPNARDGGAPTAASQQSEVSCVSPRERTGGRPAFGLWANLYSLRSRSNHGFGNCSDLRSLVGFAADLGAAFVGLSPLHALRNRGHEISPYAPLSRLFRNPLYLDVEQVPELERSREAREILDRDRDARVRAREADRIDYAEIASLHGRVLSALHRSFVAAASPERRRAFEAHRDRAGPLLRDFATFLALEDHLAARGHDRDWRRWPREFRSAPSDAVARFRADHALDVERHVFAQFELDRQLEGAADDARRRGLAIGLYQDLALGSVASGFDTWRFPETFVFGAELGAPPDLYAPEGQNWGLPPLDPRSLDGAGRDFFVRLLESNMEHAGALRMDHVLGLFRQWWIPSGWPAAKGAYLRFPAAELLAEIARRSRVRNAVVIGEDLGTVPPNVAPTLSRFGVLSSRVMLFERDARGGFRGARRYSPRALVTANTHDLPSLPAWWKGSDIELQADLGLLARGRAQERARAERERARTALLNRLRRDGHLAQAAPSPTALCSAVHAFLCSSPSPLVGLSLDDLAGETEPVNVPGLPPDRYPSWTRRMGLSLEKLGSDTGVCEAAAGARRRALP